MLMLEDFFLSLKLKTCLAGHRKEIKSNRVLIPTLVCLCGGLLVPNSQAGAPEMRTEAEEGGGSEGMECTWVAALRGEQVLEWVRGVCWCGEWATGWDEADR